MKINISLNKIHFRLFGNRFCYEHVETPGETPKEQKATPKPTVDPYQVTRETKEAGKKVTDSATLQLGALDGVTTRGAGGGVIDWSAPQKNEQINYGVGVGLGEAWRPGISVGLEKKEGMRAAVDKVRNVITEKIAQKKYTSPAEMESDIATAINSMSEKDLLTLQGQQFTMRYSEFELDFKFLRAGESPVQKLGVETVTVRRKQQGSSLTPGVGIGMQL